MNKGNKILVGVLWSLATATLILALSVVALVLGSSLEMKFNPVMVNGHILSATDIGFGQTNLEFEAEKVRDCDWRKTTWYLGEIGGRSAFVQSRHVDQPTLRDVGWHHWDSIIVDLPEATIRRGSYSITEHDCHPFWKSQSLFFLGNGKADYED